MEGELNSVTETMKSKDDPRFACGITNRSVFKFLPGHRKRIIDFVQQIKTKRKN